MPAKKKKKKKKINPKDNRISFQCESTANVEKKLKEMAMPHIKQHVKEGGINVDQSFHHDTDGFMIEICNCENLPVIPLAVGEPIGACKRGNQQRQMVQCLPPSIAVSEEPHIPCA